MIVQALLLLRYYRHTHLFDAVLHHSEHQELAAAVGNGFFFLGEVALDAQQQSGKRLHILGKFAELVLGVDAFLAIDKLLC